jgi:hypothetical protein
MKRNVIIAGGRDFSDYDYLRFVMELYGLDQDVCIISGGARGADRLGERFAKENDLPLTIFPADWTTHGKRAGYLRNEQMAQHADMVVAFWDGKSKGTKHMIDIMKKRFPAVLTLVFYY